VDALAPPDLSAAVARARATLDTLSARPEYELFARSRGVIAEQRAALSAAAEPRISAFGRAGYGRPALNPLSRDFERYWMAGVQVAWTPWNWGTTRRDREALTLQQQIVMSDEAAFRNAVQRGVTRDLASIDQMERNLAADDTIVALRERILRETRFQFAEGVITSAEYVNRETDVLDARSARASHLIQLAQARANFLTSIGLEVR
jgi:outer membrane protein TolC